MKDKALNQEQKRNKEISELLYKEYLRGYDAGKKDAIKEKAHEQYKEGWTDGMSYAYTEIIDKISDSIRDMKIVVKDM